MNWMDSIIPTSDNLFCLNSSPILDLSVKFASPICHENINKILDGAYLANFNVDFTCLLSFTTGREERPSMHTTQTERVEGDSSRN